MPPGISTGTGLTDATNPAVDAMSGWKLGVRAQNLASGREDGPAAVDRLAAVRAITHVVGRDHARFVAVLAHGLTGTTSRVYCSDVRGFLVEWSSRNEGAETPIRRFDSIPKTWELPTGIRPIEKIRCPEGYSRAA